MSKTFSAAEIELRDVLLMQDSVDPTVGAGVAAPVGSAYFRGTATSGLYIKTAAGDTEWTDVPVTIYFNVMDPAFGAAGDGVTDDRDAIQRAIDAAAVIGGTVFFPPGTYACGKDGANPYSFLIEDDNIRFLGAGWGVSTLVQTGDAAGGEYHLFQIDSGAIGTEIELLTIDQSGLTNPGSQQCSVIEIVEAEVVRINNVQFIGGVADAGAYVHVGGHVGQPCRIIWISGGMMTDAGGPCVWLEGSIETLWLIDQTLDNFTSGTKVIDISDTSGDGLVNVLIQGNLIQNNTTGMTIVGSAASERVMIQNNIILGRVEISDLSKFRFANNEVFLDAAGSSAPVLSVDDCSYGQIQKNVVGRGSTADAGIVASFDTLTRSHVQRNIWQQETEEGILEIIDPLTVQFASNLTHADDVGTGHDAYAVSAVARTADNLQFVDELITANAGAYDNGIVFLRNGDNFGNIQVTGGTITDCDVGVLFDDNGAGVFSGFQMVAGALIEATTAAYSVTAAGMFIRVGANASTFGANIIAGNGDPNSNVTARVGSLYMRLDGGATSTLYVKESGTGNTGWAAK